MNVAFAFAAVGIMPLLALLRTPAHVPDARYHAFEAALLGGGPLSQER
jgi:hypothetical protein